MMRSIADRRVAVRTGEQVYSEPSSPEMAFHGLAFHNSRFERGSSNECTLPSRYC
jgi:hypothetical protein